ncbi:MAG: CotH kinase family protein [Spirochaetaceae bacterium]
MKRNPVNFREFPLLLLLLPFLFPSCENILSGTSDDFGELSYEESIEDWEGWTFDSHSDEAEADYEQLFDSNTTTVHRIDITIDNDYYEMMEEDMENLYGEFGSGSSNTMATDDPIFVPVTLEFNDQTWWYVAMRYKGNSSLWGAWQDGNHKLPFRLNFDYYDDVWTVIEGQAFWGFEKMTFGSCKDDETLIRDVLASETFLEAGIEAARATFCRVYIDVNDGNGAVYWGLYAMIEDPSDQMLSVQFGSDSGNLYKPDDETYSTLDEDSYSSSYYDKANNEDEGDWSDIKSFIYTIEDDERSDYDLSHNNETWQEEIEELFDVDKYLSYLAVNNTIQNWDVYGEKAHNYYLYANPNDSDRFSWFPWDMNESFNSSSMCLSMNVESDYSSGNYDDWPLLENVLGQTNYRDDYDTKIAYYFDPDASPVLSEATFDNWITTYTTLVEEYVLDEIEGYTWLDDNFDSTDYAEAVEELEDQVSTRISKVSTYLE